jgi:hypothetical protein
MAPSPCHPALSGEELCFEEARAARWFARRAAEQASSAMMSALRPQLSCVEELPDMEMEGDTCAISAPLVAGRSSPGSAEAAEQAAAQIKTAALQLHATQQLEEAIVPVRPESSPAAAEQAAAVGSPVAAAERLQPQQGGAAGMGAEEAPPAGHAAEQAAGPVHALKEQHPTATSEQQQQAAQLNSTGQAAPLNPELCSNPGVPFEPTVTLSTRDAFAALNDMFGVSS